MLQCRGHCQDLATIKKKASLRPTKTNEELPCFLRLLWPWMLRRMGLRLLSRHLISFGIILLCGHEARGLDALRVGTPYLYPKYCFVVGQLRSELRLEHLASWMPIFDPK